MGLQLSLLLALLLVWHVAAAGVGQCARAEERWLPAWRREQREQREQRWRPSWRRELV